MNCSADFPEGIPGATATTTAHDEEDYLSFTVQVSLQRRPEPWAARVSAETVVKVATNKAVDLVRRMIRWITPRQRETTPTICQSSPEKSKKPQVLGPSFPECCSMTFLGESRDEKTI